MDESTVLWGEPPRYMAKSTFPQLLAVLDQQGYEVLGPTLDGGTGEPVAIVYGPIKSVEDLPRGWTEEQSPGRYRIVRRDDERWFGFTMGPHAWKRYLFPPTVTLCEARKSPSGWQFIAADEPAPRQAFLGVRACEIAAFRVQDNVFLQGAYVDPNYQQRRGASLVIAVQCTQAASTCFCTSMNAGPECRTGFDLALTELSQGFVVQVGTEEGASLLAQLETRVAQRDEIEAAAVARGQAAQQIERRLDTDGIRDALLQNLQHPHWDDVASRCISCGNCTMVCPTCFCTAVHDVTDLAGEHVTRQRTWDSCFNVDFTTMNSGEIRNHTRMRYRQWLTHKLATWIDQFGESGCVGCGRCITWCPVGIDLTQGVATLRGEIP